MSSGAGPLHPAENRVSITYTPQKGKKITKGASEAVWAKIASCIGEDTPAYRELISGREGEFKIDSEGRVYKKITTDKEKEEFVDLEEHYIIDLKNDVKECRVEEKKIEQQLKKDLEEFQIGQDQSIKNAKTAFKNDPAGLRETLDLIKDFYAQAAKELDSAKEYPQIVQRRRLLETKLKECKTGRTAKKIRDAIKAELGAQVALQVTIEAQSTKEMINKHLNKLVDDLDLCERIEVVLSTGTFSKRAPIKELKEQVSNYKKAITQIKEILLKTNPDDPSTFDHYIEGMEREFPRYLKAAAALAISKRSLEHLGDKSPLKDLSVEVSAISDPIKKMHFSILTADYDESLGDLTKVHKEAIQAYHAQTKIEITLFEKTISEIYKDTAADSSEIDKIAKGMRENERSFYQNMYKKGYSHIEASACFSFFSQTASKMEALEKGLADVKMLAHQGKNEEAKNAYLEVVNNELIPLYNNLVDHQFIIERLKEKESSLLSPLLDRLTQTPFRHLQLLVKEVETREETPITNALSDEHERMKKLYRATAPIPFETLSKGKQDPSLVAMSIYDQATTRAVRSLYLADRAYQLETDPLKKQILKVQQRKLAEETWLEMEAERASFDASTKGLTWPSIPEKFKSDFDAKRTPLLKFLSELGVLPSWEISQDANVVRRDLPGIALQQDLLRKHGLSRIDLSEFEKINEDFDEYLRPLFQIRTKLRSDPHNKALQEELRKVENRQIKLLKEVMHRFTEWGGYEKLGKLNTAIQPILPPPPPLPLEFPPPGEEELLLPPTLEGELPLTPPLLEALPLEPQTSPLENVFSQRLVFIRALQEKLPGLTDEWKPDFIKGRLFESDLSKGTAWVGFTQNLWDLHFGQQIKSHVKDIKELNHIYDDYSKELASFQKELYKLAQQPTSKEQEARVHLLAKRKQKKLKELNGRFVKWGDTAKLEKVQKAINAFKENLRNALVNNLAQQRTMLMALPENTKTPEVKNALELFTARIPQIRAGEEREVIERGPADMEEAEVPAEPLDPKVTTTIIKRGRDVVEKLEELDQMFFNFDIQKNMEARLSLAKTAEDLANE